MPNSVTFLHVTDTHLSLAGEAFARDDHKVSISGIDQETRESALELTFERLAERLNRERRCLAGALFSGDAQIRGKPGGHQLLLDLLLKHFGPLGVRPSNIVAVPGNHDVPRTSPPSSPERYKEFTEVWRQAGCVTPWLDEVDGGSGESGAHRLVAEDRLWAVYPINSSNWSHATQTLPEPLANVWPHLPALAANGDDDLETKLREQLESLARFDMARVSSAQLENLRGIIEGTPQPAAGRQLRIAVLHHHLRAPSLREELKPFADFSNLEQIRSFVRDRNIAIVVHGHKHQHAAQYEHIYSEGGDRDHRALVISGGTLGPSQETDAARLITITGMPNTPSVDIERVSVPRGGVDVPDSPAIRRRLWSTGDTPGAPVVVQGTDLSEVYARACEAAANDAKNGTLIVHLDLPSGASGDLPLPSGYPLPDTMNDGDRQEWLSNLVTWWQLDRSNLEHRIPYVHGGRLRRFGGKINQVDRVIALLRTKASTRALAILVDPLRDFTVDGDGEEFASFCLVEFKRRVLGDGRHAVDVIAFYRAQEFARWWPVNVAEIRHLQREICAALKFVPGRITTIAADARTHSSSPMQVAMPIIDRWLDQAPQRLHLLANALGSGRALDVAQSKAVHDWEQALTDLESAATEYNPDGLPIAIDGLERLAAYLDAANRREGSSLGDFVRVLKRLAASNEGFEKGARAKADFDRWAVGALDAVAELRTLTQKLVGDSSGARDAD